MPFIQLLLTAASLSAAAGGTWGVDRLMDRYGRIPEPAGEEMPAERRVDDEEDSDSDQRR